MNEHTTETITLALADEIAATQGFIGAYLNAGLDASIAGAFLVWRASTVYGASAKQYPALVVGQPDAPKSNTGKGKVYLTAIRTARYLIKHPETAKTLMGELPFADAVIEGVRWAKAQGFTSREALDTFVSERATAPHTSKPYPERFQTSVTKAVTEGELANIAEASACGKAAIVAMGRIDLASAFVDAAKAQLKALTKALGDATVTEAVKKVVNG